MTLTTSLRLAEELSALLDRPDSREILLVSFGVVLSDAVPGVELHALAWVQSEAYWTNLAAHIGRHSAPFAAVAGGLGRPGCGPR